MFVKKYLFMLVALIFSCSSSLFAWYKITIKNKSPYAFNRACIVFYTGAAWDSFGLKGGADPIHQYYKEKVIDLPADFSKGKEFVYNTKNFFYQQGVLFEDRGGAGKTLCVSLQKLGNGVGADKWANLESLFNNGFHSSAGDKTITIDEKDGKLVADVKKE